MLLHSSVWVPWTKRVRAFRRTTRKPSAGSAKRRTRGMLSPKALSACGMLWVERSEGRRRSRPLVSQGGRQGDANAQGLLGSCTTRVAAFQRTTRKRSGGSVKRPSREASRRSPTWREVCCGRERFPGLRGSRPLVLQGGLPGRRTGTILPRVYVPKRSGRTSGRPASCSLVPKSGRAEQCTCAVFSRDHVCERERCAGRLRAGIQVADRGRRWLDPTEDYYTATQPLH